MSRIRQREIHARRKRHEILRKLRDRYTSAKGMTKEQVLAKLKRVAPQMTEAQFLATAKKG